jgi:hypothetical protein
VGGGEHRGQHGRVAAGVGAGGQRDLERERDGVRGAPALVGRQQARRRPGRGRRVRRRAAAGEGARGRPRRQAVGPEADALDAGGAVGAAPAAVPNSSEQLLPPKPKELFIA